MTRIPDEERGRREIEDLLPLIQEVEKRLEGMSLVSALTFFDAITSNFFNKVSIRDHTIGATHLTTVIAKKIGDRCRAILPILIPPAER